MAAYKCKIINNSSHDLIIKIAGANAQFNLNLRQGQSYITPNSQFLLEGERIVIGWDDFDETIVCYGLVTINKKKKITLRDDVVAAKASLHQITGSSIEEEDDPGL